MSTLKKFPYSNINNFELQNTKNNSNLSNNFSNLKINKSTIFCILTFLEKKNLIYKNKNLSKYSQSTLKKSDKTQFEIKNTTPNSKDLNLTLSISSISSINDQNESLSSQESSNSANYNNKSCLKCSDCDKHFSNSRLLKRHKLVNHCKTLI